MYLKKNLIGFAILPGFISGTFDGLAASIMYYAKSGKDPLNVFRFVASGVFGTTALSGGTPMALWGILFHYIIAFGWTLLYFALYPKIKILSKNWVVAGVAYGIFVWLMMNLVIVPFLSQVEMNVGREWSGILTGAFILIVCIGLPISFSANYYLKKRL